jgi:hypothetical protein
MAEYFPPEYFNKEYFGPYFGASGSGPIPISGSGGTANGQTETGFGEVAVKGVKQYPGGFSPGGAPKKKKEFKFHRTVAVEVPRITGSGDSSQSHASKGKGKYSEKKLKLRAYREWLKGKAVSGAIESAQVHSDVAGGGVYYAPATGVAKTSQGHSGGIYGLLEIRGGGSGSQGRGSSLGDGAADRFTDDELDQLIILLAA